jgi:hypothetical protein
MRDLTFFFLGLLLIIFMIGCDNPTESKNHTPNIIEIITDTQYIKADSYVYITAIAIDKDCDSLSYYWRVSGGSIQYGSQSNPTRCWRTPSRAGQYSVTCTVSDGQSIDSDSIIVSVGLVW